MPSSHSSLLCSREVRSGHGCFLFGCLQTHNYLTGMGSRKEASRKCRLLLHLKTGFEGKSMMCHTGWHFPRYFHFGPSVAFCARIIMAMSVHFIIPFLPCLCPSVNLSFSSTFLVCVISFLPPLNYPFHKSLNKSNWQSALPWFRFWRAVLCFLPPWLKLVNPLMQLKSDRRCTCRKNTTPKFSSTSRLFWSSLIVYEHYTS